MSEPIGSSDADRMRVEVQYLKLQLEEERESSLDTEKILCLANKQLKQLNEQLGEALKAEDARARSGEARRIRLEGAIETMEGYLALRVRMRDWHGVMDAAADLRELEAELRGVKGDADE
jgi:hypothetical protein